MKLHVLVFIPDSGTAEISHHLTRAQAERVAAERIMSTMPTESTVDLSGVATAMDQAFTDGDDAAVIRFFERVKRRKPVHIQECRVPWIQALFSWLGCGASAGTRAPDRSKEVAGRLAKCANKSERGFLRAAQGRQPARLGQDRGGTDSDVSHQG
jgi:hypothetical protein